MKIRGKFCVVSSSVSFCDQTLFGKVHGLSILLEVVVILLLLLLLEK